MSEADHQSSLLRWARVREATLPELKLLHCVPNGGYALSKHQGWMMKQRGVKSGVPDLCLPVARKGRHGLYAEIKNDNPKGVVSAEQKWWIEALNAQGYLAIVCYGWDEAREAIESYLSAEAEL